MFFGIIDILQDYDISKKLEHAYKSIQYDPTSISAVDPKQYSRRFRDFLLKIFEEEIWRLNIKTTSILQVLRHWLPAEGLSLPIYDSGCNLLLHVQVW